MRQIRIILGGIISLISYFGWIFILTAVSFIFFSEKEVIFGSEVVKSTITINPIFNWLMAGLFPVFFFASQYILCNNSHGENNTGREDCNVKFKKLAHPDLHFAFPVATNEKIKKHPVSNLFLEEWRSFVEETPYGSLFNWYQQLGIENKPVGMLNTNGYFDHSLKQLDVMVREGFLKQSNRDMLLVSDSIPELINKMNNYKAPKLSKVVNTVASK